jgi:hypothetical protein
MRHGYGDWDGGPQQTQAPGYYQPPAPRQPQETPTTAAYYPRPRRDRATAVPARAGTGGLSSL